ncbi:uncharacterized protein TNCV_2133741 [Trichonephila clavipes]|nr:uncharacterized protein TNCV_2133741 [Trichonephila clavipes]
MSRRKQQSAFDLVSEFGRGRIVAYRDSGLSFREIGSRVGRNQTTVMRICDHWMQEGTTDRRGRSHPPQCTTSREDRQIVRMAVTDRSVTSRTIAQHIESATHHSVCAYHSTPFTAEWSVRKTSIAWSTLDAPSGGSPLAVQSSAGSVKSIKKITIRRFTHRNSNTSTINLLQCTNLSNIPITATPHKTLNSSKGVIYCPDLIPLPDSEIEEELASQGVEAVKRITSIKDVITNTKSKKDTATQTEISHIATPTNIANLTSESHKDSPIAQKPITNNLIDQETILSLPETSSTDLESLNQDKRSPETSHLSVPSDAEALMEIDKSSIKRPATDIVQEAAKILKPSIQIESGGIQTTKEVEDVQLLSKKRKSRRSFLPIKYDSEKPKGSP